MSSILDALEKLESRRTQASGPEPPRRRRRSVTPLLASAAAAAFAAGIGLTVVWLRPVDGVPAPIEVGVTIPAPTAPPATTPPATSPPPTLAPPRPVEQPWAEVVTPPSPRAAAEAPPLPLAAAARPPARERPAERTEPAPPVAAAVDPAPTPLAAAARPAGAPAVRVSFLVFSGAPERRSVALTIDGGLVTLHEGEGASGLSVARILPDAVELTWQGQSFRVPARD